MYERILVPLDGSNAAEIVLPYAEEIAARTGAEIILLSVSDPTTTGMDHLYRAYIERIAEQVRRQIGDRGAGEKAKVRAEVLTGRAAAEILRYIDESNVSLITMAGRGSSGERPWLLGNIASKILQTVAKPVLLVRVPAGDTALKQKRLVKRILLPLDTSRAGEAAIPHAEALARLLGAEVRLFHVLEPAPVPFLVAPGVEIAYPPVSAETEGRIAAAAVAYLQSVENTLTEKGITVSSEVSLGHPASEIIRYAEANAIDLIAVSTHGRSGIGRWVYGSVTEKLLQAGSKPILTVRAAKNDGQ
ncbi:MAG: universal stress protein [Dehalococcoidia bacterium]|nr:universal stress protein [Dehalococcoidia bacterium]